MAHLRVEATDNRDKFRITMDTEQIFLNVCDSVKGRSSSLGSHQRYDGGCSHGRKQRESMQEVDTGSGL